MKPAGLRNQLLHVTATLVATFFGSGFFPKAPGTFGSLASLPLIYVLNGTGPGFRLTFWTLVLVLGTWATTRFMKRTGLADPHAVVIDEVLGMAVTTALSVTWTQWAIGFFLFRFFDILKPWPIRQLDRWSKQKGLGWAGAFGVIADDLLAGVLAGAGLLILQSQHVI